MHDHRGRVVGALHGDHQAGGFCGGAAGGGVAEHLGECLAAGAQGLHRGVVVVHRVGVAAVGAHHQGAVLARDGGRPAGGAERCAACKLGRLHGEVVAQVVAQHVARGGAARCGVGRAPGFHSIRGIVHDDHGGVADIRNHLNGLLVFARVIAQGHRVGGEADARLVNHRGFEGVVAHVLVGLERPDPAVVAGGAGDGCICGGHPLAVGIEQLELDLGFGRDDGACLLGDGAPVGERVVGAAEVTCGARVRAHGGDVHHGPAVVHDLFDVLVLDGLGRAVRSDVLDHARARCAAGLDHGLVQARDVQHVGARTAVHCVVAPARDDGVVAVAALDAVVARTAVQGVVAVAAVQRVVAIATVQGVVAVAAVELVVAVTAAQRVVAVAAVQGVVAVAAIQRVVAIAPAQGVLAIATVQAVVAVAAIELVVAVTAVQRVIAVATIQGVVAIAAREAVIAVVAVGVGFVGVAGGGGVARRIPCAGGDGVAHHGAGGGQAPQAIGAHGGAAHDVVGGVAHGDHSPGLAGAADGVGGAGQARLGDVHVGAGVDGEGIARGGGGHAVLRGDDLGRVGAVWQALGHGEAVAAIGLHGGGDRGHDLALGVVDLDLHSSAHGHGAAEAGGGVVGDAVVGVLAGVAGSIHADGAEAAVVAVAAAAAVRARSVGGVAVGVARTGRDGAGGHRARGGEAPGAGGAHGGAADDVVVDVTHGDHSPWLAGAGDDASRAALAGGGDADVGAGVAGVVAVVDGRSSGFVAVGQVGSATGGPQTQ